MSNIRQYISVEGIRTIRELLFENNNVIIEDYLPYNYRFVENQVKLILLQGGKK